MKKNILIILAITLIAGFTTAWLVSKKTTKPFDQYIIQNTPTSIAGNYLGSNYQGNYIWGGAMNLAWTELSNNIIKEPIKLNTTDKIALEMANKFNNPIFSKNDLDEASYYIKSGYGQETLDAINKESKQKFPDKSFGNLNFQLFPKDIISYAYFLKKVEYIEQFSKTKMTFNNENVKGFNIQKPEQYETLKLINYDNDDKFIILLQLKDQADQLILAKGYNMTNPQEITIAINKYDLQNLPTVDHLGKFAIPNLQLDYHRDYNELIGKSLLNKNFEEYAIGIMFENIKFNMNETGAKAENEAVIATPNSSAGPGAKKEPIKLKNIVLDKPYWVILKRANSKNPYFILGINNTALMEK